MMAGEDGSVRLASSTEEEESSGADENAPEDYELEGPGWHGVVFALVPLLVISLGTGQATWSRALTAGLMALTMLFFPARRRPPPLALTGLLGAVLGPLVAFLPRSFGAAMPWRDSLTTDWGIQLPGSITPQTWVTVEDWLWLCQCLAWLAWCFMRGFSGTQRRVILSSLAIGGLMICWLTIMEGLKLFQLPWWPGHGQVVNMSHFGPFSNRNHISSLAAITCILCAASAYDSQRRKQRMWFIYAIGFFLPVVTIFMNSSRAGLLLLFLGITLWLGTASMRRGFFKKMAVTASFILVIAAALFVADGGLSAKTKSLAKTGTAMSSDMRIILYKDSLRIASTAPWSGIGLGNFDCLFPLSVSNFDPHVRAIHPESDLLWKLVEGGLITLVPCMLLITWVALSTGPWFGKKSKGRAHRHDRRARNTAAICLLLGLLHGLIDVPIHNLGYFSLLALLAGVSLRPRCLPKAARWPEKIATVIIAFAVLALGVTWAAIATGKPLLPGTSSALMLQKRAHELANSSSASDALPLLDQAIQMRPLDYSLYFDRARTRVILRQDTEAALLDYTRSRLLEPHFAYACYYEGLDWLGIRPEYAVLGWREFIKRFPQAAPGIHGYYHQMVDHSTRFPEIREAVWKLANTQELKLGFLGSVNTRQDFELCLRDILARQPDLAGLESAQRMSLFEMWNRLGDREALLAAIASNKIWERDGGWKILAEYYAQKSDFRKACEIAAIYLPSLHRAPPGGSTDLKTLENAFLFNTLDPQLGINLFQAYKNNNDYDNAIRTLEKVRTATNPPNYIDLEIAALYLAKEDFRRAWEHYRIAATASQN